MSDLEDARRATADEAFDEWLDAVAAGEPYHLVCANGHGLLPPRRICPTCGARQLEPTLLDTPGRLETFTTVAVPTPAFADDAPYVTGIASFGPVRLTGIVTAEADALAIGTRVRPDVDTTATDARRVLVLRPVTDATTDDR